MPDISHLLRPDIAALEPYTPIVPLEVLAERLGRPIDQIIKLDANENPYGASPRALAALASYPHYAIYPDPEHTALRAALSAYTGQPAARLICGAGSDELIDLLMRAFLMPGDAIINCGPTFGMYPFDAQLFAARVIAVPRTEGFAVDIEAVADAAQAHGAKMVFLANPNNPTGTLTPRAEIERLLELPMLVVVDEAYAEFAGQSLIDMVGSRPNLVVLRTFSKWAGLAGLRVGYAAVPEELIAHLWKIKQPYNVNCAAEQAALASLADMPYLQGLIDQIVAERGRLMAALAELPLLRPFPSSANFVLCRVAAEPGAGPQRAMAIKRHLEERGILIRYYTTPALADCIRISVGRPEQNDALLAALRELA
ncbi:histidinol-phosphate transaminase [Chloroflexia bacterium SDU3-3]|nr:histidinol-phosphate transaminase [Chloroflexia bacterium SDU3-3]